MAVCLASVIECRIMQLLTPVTINLAKGQQVWLKPRQVKVFAVSEMALEEGGSGI